MEKWVNFYRPFFPNQAETETWVAQCEALAAPDNHAKLMMHQAQRLVTIGDSVPAIQGHAESLQLMFYIIAAEHLSKLHDKYQGDGQSRHYVRRFFTSFVVGGDQATLAGAFVNHAHHLMPALNFDQAVDLLYDIRCDVVHEGNYWGFAFHDGDTPMLNTDPDVIAHITLQGLRCIVIRGAIRAISERLAAP